MVKAQSSLRQPSTAVTAAASSGVRQRSKDGGVLRQVAPNRPTSAASGVVGSDQVQIQMYLSKLKELVPHMPKDRKVSKLEVIQHVIDYICQLQTTLETQPRRRADAANQRLVAAADAADAAVNDLRTPSGSIPAANVRQPLSLLTSITNVSGVCCPPDMIDLADKSRDGDCNVRS